jgi:hypothetical protein
MHDKITRRHVSIGAAIERAAAELPEGYDLMIEIEKDAGTVTLLIPPMGDDEGGQALHDWEGDHFGYQINKAIDYAIEHHRAHAA